MNHSVFLTKLSRTVSHALRHEPWLYGLKLDIHGWVRLTDLLISLRLLKNEWRHLRENDIIQMISESDRNRFELRNGRIRALYGHSLPEYYRDSLNHKHVLCNWISYKALPERISNILMNSRF